MFCPKCGKSEQTPNTYCRTCGEFLPDFSKKQGQAVGGNTPEEQIRTTLFFNLMTAVIALAMAILLYATHWGTEGKDVATIAVYIAAAFLTVIAAWQSVAFFIGLKLRKVIRNRRRNNVERTPPVIDTSFKLQNIPDAQTRELLPEADFSNVVPASVTEDETRQLETIPRQQKSEQEKSKRRAEK